MCALAKPAKKIALKAVKKATSKTSAPEADQKTRKSSTAVEKKEGSGSLAQSVLGKKAPIFTSPATSGLEISSSQLKGIPWVIYFYPKDHTPGCTVEGQDFAKLAPKFKALGCQILGVSKDSLKRHESFKEKFKFPFELIADEDEALCRKFDVIQMKKLYGREYEGIERSTFLVDASGIVRGEWRRVKVPGHVDEVFAALKNLKES